jgi:ABC-type nitrate/sulfonate/bicarbonate transport system substrate-binding protein
VSPRPRHRSVALAAGLLVVASAAHAQAPEETTLAVPRFSLTFSSTFLAEELRLWEKEGLKVKISTVAGVGAANAVLAGCVDFAPVSSPTLVRADARGQKLFAIAQLMDRMPLEAVLRKDVAEKAGITPGMPIEKRAQALRGKRMAVDSVNTINHLLLKYLARKGGLDPEKDLTVTPMQPPNMIAAIKSGAIDGFLMSMPWPVMAVRDGAAVSVMSITRGDLAELTPFSFIVLVTRAGFCDGKSSMCKKMIAGYKRALALMQDQPAEAVAALRKKFDKTDPAVLADAFEQVRAASSRTGLVPEPGLKRASSSRSTPA